MTNRKPTATSRLKQDYLRLKRDPVPYIQAEPMPSNILEWHYVVKGPEDSPYYGGYYHGTLVFPREFPFKPPTIYMLTPNGRFKTNTRLCLSISDFHPDTWNPAWSVATILTGLLSFMLEKTPTLGSTESTIYEKQQLAKKSLTFNLKNSHFRELFPDICDEINGRLRKQMSTAAALAAGSNSSLDAAMISNSQNLNGIVDIKNNNNNNNSNTRKHGNCMDSNSNRNSSVGNGRTVSNNCDENSVNNNLLYNNLNSNSNETNSNEENSNWQSICSNLIVIISFAIFALIVNYVIKNLSQE